MIRGLRLLLVLVVTAVVGALIIAASRWNSASTALMRELERQSAERTTSLRPSDELAALPAPVQRYLHAALGDDSPMIQFARIEHAGEFLLKAPNEWRPFYSTQWTFIDDSTARATLGVAETVVRLEFHFGRDGLVERVYTPARARDVGGRAVSTPWEGRVLRYERREGILIPIEAEVAWILPDGRQPYWRGTVRSVVYDSAAR